MTVLTYNSIGFRKYWFVMVFALDVIWYLLMMVLALDSISLQQNWITMAFAFDIIDRYYKNQRTLQLMGLGFKVLHFG